MFPWRSRYLLLFRGYSRKCWWSGCGTLLWRQPSTPLLWSHVEAVLTVHGCWQLELRSHKEPYAVSLAHKRLHISLVRKRLQQQMCFSSANRMGLKSSLGLCTFSVTDLNRWSLQVKKRSNMKRVTQGLSPVWYWAHLHIAMPQLVLNL